MYSLHARLRVGLRDRDLPACAPRTRPSATTTSGQVQLRRSLPAGPDARLALHRGARDRSRDHGRHLRGCLSGDPELQRPQGRHGELSRLRAWTEGFADWLPLAVNGTSVFKWQANSTYDLEPPTSNNAGFQDGDTVEGRVAGALLDLHDRRAESWDTPQGLANLTVARKHRSARARSGVAGWRAAPRGAGEVRRPMRISA